MSAHVTAALPTDGEFEIDIACLSGGVLQDITPEMLRFLTGQDRPVAIAPISAPPSSDAGAVPRTSPGASSRPYSGPSASPPALPAITSESSFTDGTFEAGLEPFQLLVSGAQGGGDRPDSSNIPTESESMLFNLSDFGSRGSSGSSEGGKQLATGKGRNSGPGQRAAALAPRTSQRQLRSKGVSRPTAEAEGAIPLKDAMVVFQMIYRVSVRMLRR